MVSDLLVLTCPQQVVRVVLVEFRERHDKRTKKIKGTSVGRISRVIFRTNWLATGVKLNCEGASVLRWKLVRWNLAALQAGSYWSRVSSVQCSMLNARLMAMRHCVIDNAALLLADNTHHQ